MAAKPHLRIRSAAIATLALVALGLVVAVATASASDGTFKRTWGWGVKDGTAAFQICIGGCQAGIAGSGDGQFDDPFGAATDSAGNVYVVDAGNNRIEKFDSGGTFITKWGSAGSGDGQFEAPFGVATDSAGNVYVADTGNNRIEKFDSNGTFITKWGSVGSGDGQFRSPQGVATDAAGNVYVVDQNSSRIEKFDSNGNFITKWGTFGSGDGQFNQPRDLATDAGGNVYVSDRGNSRIEKFTSGGTFITKWGSFGSGDGQFEFPQGVATDAAGNVYVADTNNDRIEKFDSNGTFITKWGSSGSGDGQFSLPIGVATDAAGNLYVADAENSRIEKFGTKTLRCRGKLRSGTYRQIKVPAGSTCNGTNATVTVLSNVRVNPGAIFILGDEDHDGGGTIHGGVRAVDAASLQLHFATVRGSVTVSGGDGFFSTVEDNVIRGHASIKGYHGTWLGFIRNRVRGSVRLSDNILTDPDANEYVTNTIGGNLVCHRNDPAPQIGDSGGSPNVVAGRKVDQCKGL